MTIFISLIALLQQEFRHPYSSSGEGSWVKLRTVMTMNGEEYVSTQTSTVLHATPNEVVVKTVVEMAGMAPREEEQKLSTQGLPGSAQPNSKKTGEEELEIEGKRYPCEIWEFHTPDATIRAWLNRDAAVPGGALKTESTTVKGDREVKTSSRVIKLKDLVRVGDKDIECAVLEVHSEAGPMTMEGKVWNSAEVPGFMVKSEMRMKSITTRTQALAFEKK